MSDSYVGEIRMFAGNFAPSLWAFCEGQLMLISQNEALFSLIGINYGGDGRSTFALPDLQGRAPIHAGWGPGLSQISLSQQGGSETSNISYADPIEHSHGVVCSTSEATSTDPTEQLLANRTIATYKTTVDDPAKLIELYPATVEPVGQAGSSLGNMQPFLTVNFIICLKGVYPSRN